MAGAAEAVTDPPATLRARMIADLANFVPAGTNVEAVADVLLYHHFANMHEVMEVELTASDLIELFPFDLDLVVGRRPQCSARSAQLPKPCMIATRI